MSDYDNGFARAQRQYDRQTDESHFRPQRTKKQQEAYDNWLEDKADEAREERLIEQAQRAKTI